MYALFVVYPSLFAYKQLVLHRKSVFHVSRSIVLFGGFNMFVPNNSSNLLNYGSKLTSH